MKTNLAWDLGLGVSILGAERIYGRWIILARWEELGSCPACGKRLTSRHGWHERHLRDLPTQGAGVTVKLRMRRWRCRNKACQRQTFVEQLPEVAAPQAHRTRRAAELVHLFGHSVGGRSRGRISGFFAGIVMPWNMAQPPRTLNFKRTHYRPMTWLGRAKQA